MQINLSFEVIMRNISSKSDGLTETIIGKAEEL